MRDNHDKMPEMLDAFEEGGHYFVIIMLTREGQSRRFRFGTSQEGYLAIRRVFQLRPFATMPGASYRFFFVPAVRRFGDSNLVMMTTRIEQAEASKQFEVEAPRDLVANLMWFWELDDWSKANHLAGAA